MPESEACIFGFRFLTVLNNCLSQSLAAVNPENKAELSCAVTVKLPCFVCTFIRLIWAKTFANNKKRKKKKEKKTERK